MDDLLLSPENKKNLSPNKKQKGRSGNKPGKVLSKCGKILSLSNLLMLGEIVILRVFRYLPSLCIVMVAFHSMVYFFKDGVAWHEAGNLFQCEEYWWTPLLFVNDIIPTYVKDFRGCMRYAAIYAIEVKLSFFLPIIV